MALVLDQKAQLERSFDEPGRGLAGVGVEVF